MHEKSSLRLVGGRGGAGRGSDIIYQLLCSCLGLGSHYAIRLCAHTRHGIRVTYPSILG